MEDWAGSIGSMSLRRAVTIGKLQWVEAKRRIKDGVGRSRSSGSSTEVRMRGHSRRTHAAPQ